MTDEKEIRDPEIENPETEKPEPLEKSGQKPLWPWIAGLGVVVVVAAAVFIVWIGKGDRGTAGEPLSFSNQMTFPVPGKKELRLDDFLIPLTTDPDHTGMSFSLVIRYRGSQWSKISEQEKIWLRARIYDTLVTQFQKMDKPPSENRVVLWADQALRQLYPDRGFDELMVDNVFML